MKYLRSMLIIIACLLPTASFAERKSPVDGGTLTSSPGMRLDPFGSGRMVMHNGWDIAVPVGTEVHPTQEGTVYFAGPYKGYGNLVAIEHGKGYISLYGHNSQLLVTAGTYVTPRTVIALSGSTGRSTGPHLHYEVRQLPSSYQKERQAKLTAQLKESATGQIDTLVENFASGKGGPELEATILPDDIDHQ